MIEYTLDDLDKLKRIVLDRNRSTRSFEVPVNELDMPIEPRNIEVEPTTTQNAKVISGTLPEQPQMPRTYGQSMIDPKIKLEGVRAQQARVKNPIQVPVNELELGDATNDIGVTKEAPVSSDYNDKLNKYKLSQKNAKAASKIGVDTETPERAKNLAKFAKDAEYVTDLATTRPPKFPSSLKEQFARENLKGLGEETMEHAKSIADLKKQYLDEEVAKQNARYLAEEAKHIPPIPKEALIQEVAPELEKRALQTGATDSERLAQYLARTGKAAIKAAPKALLGASAGVGGAAAGQYAGEKLDKAIGSGGMEAQLLLGSLGGIGTGAALGSVAGPAGAVAGAGAGALYNALTPNVTEGAEHENAVIDKLQKDAAQRKLESAITSNPEGAKKAQDLMNAVLAGKLSTSPVFPQTPVSDSKAVAPKTTELAAPVEQAPVADRQANIPKEKMGENQKLAKGITKSFAAGEAADKAAATATPAATEKEVITTPSGNPVDPAIQGLYDAQTAANKVRLANQLTEAGYRIGSAIAGVRPDEGIISGIRNNAKEADTIMRDFATRNEFEKNDSNGVYAQQLRKWVKDTYGQDLPKGTTPAQMKELIPMMFNKYKQDKALEISKAKAAEAAERFKETQRHNAVVEGQGAAKLATATESLGNRKANRLFGKVKYIRDSVSTVGKDPLVQSINKINTLAGRDLFTVKNALDDITKHPNDPNRQKVTSQLLAETQIGLAAAISGKNNFSDSLRKEIGYDTMAALEAKIKTFVNSKPEEIDPASAIPILQQSLHMLSRLQDISHRVLYERFGKSSSAAKASIVQEKDPADQEFLRNNFADSAVQEGIPRDIIVKMADKDILKTYDTLKQQQQSFVKENTASAKTLPKAEYDKLVKVKGKAAVDAYMNKMGYTIK